MLVWIPRTAGRFASVVREAEKLQAGIPENDQVFFHDILLAPSRYMEKLSRALNSFLIAYKTDDTSGIREMELANAYGYFSDAREALMTTCHGVFKDWYRFERLFGLNRIQSDLEKLRDKYPAIID